MWIDQKASVWRKPAPQHKGFEQWRNRTFLLRARMLAFVQQILAFATFEVLEPNWRRLETKLANVDTVDQLLSDHVDFLDTCLKECMLTSSKLLTVSAHDSPLPSFPCSRPSLTNLSTQFNTILYPPSARFHCRCFREPCSLVPPLPCIALNSPNLPVLPCQAPSTRPAMMRPVTR